MDEQRDNRDNLTGLLEVAISIMKAADTVASAIKQQAEATVLLARATAGEFDEHDETIDPDATRLPDGYRGMR